MLWKGTGKIKTKKQGPFKGIVSRVGLFFPVEINLFLPVNVKINWLNNDNNDKWLFCQPKLIPSGPSIIAQQQKLTGFLMVAYILTINVPVV
jgi:hypothetical protein